MARKRSWFDLLKRLFVSEPKKKQEKKERRRWIPVRFKIKRLLTSAPSSFSFKERTLSQTEEEQSKRAVTVAIATAAAAEAAVAAAQAAAEVVRLTHVPQSRHHLEKGQKAIREKASIRIQAVFRGYLARKALRALKGLVRLQAMVRGRAVRRQALNTLKSLQSLVNIQSQACSMRIGFAEDGWDAKEKQQMLTDSNELGDKERRHYQTWEGNLLSKELKTTLLSRQEAMSRRERIKKYSFPHQERRRTGSEPGKVAGMCSNWLEHWVDAHAKESDGTENFESLACLNALDRYGEEVIQLRMRETRKNRKGGFDSPISLPRTSLNQQKCGLLGDYDPCLSFSDTPSYMSTTESARAKARASSAPKQRLETRDVYSDQNSPANNRLSFCSSAGNDVTFLTRNAKPTGCQQRSLSVKGSSGPTKSNLISNDPSFDSEFLLLNWNQQNAHR